MLLLKSPFLDVTQEFHRPKLTMVPDLRMAMKVGAYSMSNEIRTHLEATGLRYFTASSAKNISWHIRKKNECDYTYVLIVCIFCMCVYLIVFPITQSFAPGLQAAMASSRQRLAASTKRCPTSSTSPIKKVSEVSPW